MAVSDFSDISVFTIFASITVFSPHKDFVSAYNFTFVDDVDDFFAFTNIAILLIF